MRRAPSASNVGRDPRPMGTTRPHTTTTTTLRPHNKENAAVLDDKYHRVLEENGSLKKERNTLEEKLKELKTKFRRLTRDLKPDANGDYALPSVGPSRNESMTGPSSGPSSMHPPAPPVHYQTEMENWHRERQRLEERLRVTNAQLEYSLKAQQQQPAGQNTRPPHHQANSSTTNSTPGADTSALASHLDIMRQQLAAAHSRSVEDERRVISLQKERDALHTEINSLQSRLRAADTIARGSGGADGGASDRHRQQMQELLADLQKNRDQQLTDMHTIDSLTRERDGFKLRLRMLEEEASSATATSSANNDVTNMTSLHDLQRALAEARIQMTVLTNRLNFSTGQVDTLKKECERLVDDLRSLNNQHAEVKKNMFQMEHEKMALQVRCEKVSDLESSLQHKSEELLKNEKELLRLIDRLQSCGRETEMQVRREMGDRMSELEGMRDKAEQDRRANEWESLNLKLQLGDLTRRAENATHDAQLFRKEVERLEAEKKELMERAALGGNSMMGTDLNDDVQRAVALASMKSRMGANASGVSGMSHTGQNPHHNNTHNATVQSTTGGAKDILDMWEGMEWNEGWELAKLREAMSTSALDMELSQQRCTQMEKTILEKNELLVGISSERDELLNENIEMRHRISGVQTALARQQLRKLQEAYDSDATNSRGNNIQLTIDRIACDPDFQKCDDGSIYAPTLFFTVDGIPNFSSMVSETFYSLEETLSVRFLFEKLEAEFVNMQVVQGMQIVLQLHQAFGEESVIVAEATLSGGRLLHCRFDGVFSDALPLFSTDGEKMGHVHITIEAPNLLIPLILARPIVSPVTPDAIRSALISFRSVIALRVQVFRASGLVGGGNGNAMPSPYVFYTSTSPHGVTFIKDTVVTSSNRSQTTDPVFDILPQDHTVVLDAEFIRFMHDGALSFVVFDHKAEDVQSNLGVAVVSLKDMLASPSAMITRTEPLHPQGSVEIGISWVRSIEAL